MPVVLGGIEASLRRVAHYDYWEDKLRPSILADAKAAILVYGMGEAAACEIARRLAAGNRDLGGIRGTAVMLGAKASAAAQFGDHLRLPDWEALQADKQLLLPLTRQVEAEQSPFCGRRLVQFHGDRAVVIEPPAFPLDEAELDALYELPFQRLPHPSYRDEIPAFTMIKDSVTVLRGCAGGCTFCGLGLHQGRFLSSRSEASVLRELRRMAEMPSFRGTVTDLGGPTANLYGCENGLAEACHKCRRPSCLFPRICPVFKVEEEQALRLYRNARATPDIKHVFIQSGIRMDVALRTPEYLRELIRHHVSGHLKVAPEHLHPEVLRRMRKPAGVFEKFMEQFRHENAGGGQGAVPGALLHLQLSRLHGPGDGRGGGIPPALELEPAAGAGLHPAAHDAGRGHVCDRPRLRDGPADRGGAGRRRPAGTAPGLPADRRKLISV